MNKVIRKSLATIIVLITLSGSAYAKPNHPKNPHRKTSHHQVYTPPKRINTKHLTKDERALISQANDFIKYRNYGGFDAGSWNLHNSAGEAGNFYNNVSIGIVVAITLAMVGIGSMLLVPPGSLTGCIILPVEAAAIYGMVEGMKNVQEGLTKSYIYRIKVNGNIAKVWFESIQNGVSTEPSIIYTENLENFIKVGNVWKFADTNPKIIKSAVIYPNNHSKDRVTTNPQKSSFGTSI